MHNITTLRPGEHFMFKGFEWCCLDPHQSMAFVEDVSE